MDFTEISAMVLRYECGYSKEIFGRIHGAGYRVMTPDFSESSAAELTD